MHTSLDSLEGAGRGNAFRSILGQLACEPIDGVCAGTGPQSAGRHVSTIQARSEINLQSHSGRVSGQGAVGNGTDLGLCVHPLLAVDANDAACLGLAPLHLWQRMQGEGA